MAAAEWLKGTLTLTGVISHREFALYSLGEPHSSDELDPPDVTWPAPFSPASYSRYKYGSVLAARTFARALGTVFAERHPGLACAPRLLITSAPYAYVPTAATTLANWPDMRARLAPWTVRARTSYPQVLASAQEAGIVSPAEGRELMRFYADPRRHTWRLTGGPSHN